MANTKKFMTDYWRNEIAKRKKNNASDFKIKLATNHLKAWNKMPNK